MKKINLRGISEILSEKEMKNVMGGSGNGGCSGDSASTCSGNCPIIDFGMGPITFGTCTWITDLGGVCGCA
jgi:natural product precursor